MERVRSARTRAALLLVVALMLIAVVGCVPRGPVRFTVSAGVERPERMAVIFFVDGLDIRRVDELLAVGALPNIEKRFAKGGLRVEHAIGAMPSDTYPNTVSLFTGVSPGHHGVLGNRWFDRDSLETEYYITAGTFRNVNGHFRQPTLFEMLPDRFTIAVQSHTRRGASLALESDVAMFIDWAGGGYVNFDRRTGWFVGRVAREAERAGRWPALSAYYFPGVDEVGHRYGRTSPEYQGAIRNADAQIGRVTDALESAGLLESTYCVLVSDHGHVDYDKSVSLDVGRWLERYCGLAVTEEITHIAGFPARLERMRRIDAVVLNGSFRRSVIHLRGERGWHERPSTAAVQRVLNSRGGTERSALCIKGELRLFEHPAVELAATPIDADHVRVVSRAGEAVVERTRGEAGTVYALKNETGDALGYLGDPRLADFVAAGPHASREWLKATAEARIPDFVPQVVEMFDSRRAGDIVLFASDAGTFFSGEACGHGSCLAADAKITLFFSGPEIAPGARIARARIVDVFPTVLDLLGESRRMDQRTAIDGISLRADMDAARMLQSSRP